MFRIEGPGLGKRLARGVPVAGLEREAPALQASLGATLPHASFKALPFLSRCVRREHG